MKSKSLRAWSKAVLLSAALAALSCGNTASSGPCQGLNPAPQCGLSCDSNLTCGDNFYCSADGTCTADCTPGDNQCSSGAMCLNGLCVGGDLPDADPGCPNVGVNLTPQTPIVMLLIDQSGSMTSPFGSSDRWDSVRVALTDPTSGAVTRLQDRVLFGASLYNSNGGFNGGTCPILTRSVGPPPGLPSLNNRQAIDDLLANNSPSGDTPTGEAIDGIVPDLLTARGPDDTSPLVIVVATDGEPDTCTVPNPQDGQPESVAAATNAFNQGIQTYILSVGTGTVSDQHLQDMANVGIGQPLTGNAPFFVAGSPQQLVDAFDTIIRGVRTCTFTLDGTVDGAGQAQGTVTLDTGNGPVTLTQGTDYIFPDSMTIELVGAACDTYLSSDTVIFDAQFPCGTVVR